MSCIKTTKLPQMWCFTNKSSPITQTRSVPYPKKRKEKIEDSRNNNIKDENVKSLPSPYTRCSFNGENFPGSMSFI